MKNVMILIVLSAVLPGLAGAQVNKKKPAEPQRIVKGTTQMAGDNGKVNVAYTIGQTDSVNITLTNARFSVVREIVGDQVIAPAKDEKLLVIDFVAHNPNPKSLPFNGGVLKFTGVDQESVNRLYNGTYTRAKTGEVFSTDLKPAQKVELRTVIVVPAQGTVPKLIVEHRNGGPVLRYDLKPLLKPIDPKFGDSKDETGMTPAEIWNIAPDSYAPMSLFDIKLNGGSLESHGTKFGPNTLGDTQMFVSVKLTVKGQSPLPAALRFQGEYIDENGEKYPIVKIAQITTEDHVNRQLEMDAEYTLRLVAVVSSKAKIKTMKLQDVGLGRPSRTYVFNVG